MCRVVSVPFSERARSLTIPVLTMKSASASAPSWKTTESRGNRRSMNCAAISRASASGRSPRRAFAVWKGRGTRTSSPGVTGRPWTGSDSFYRVRGKIQKDRPPEAPRTGLREGGGPASGGQAQLGLLGGRTRRVKRPLGPGETGPGAFRLGHSGENHSRGDDEQGDQAGERDAQSQSRHIDEDGFHGIHPLSAFNLLPRPRRVCEGSHK